MKSSILYLALPWLGLFFLTAPNVGARVVTFEEQVGAEAHCAISDEYLYGDRPSYKITMPKADSTVIFRPDLRDWSGYRQLVFTLYNPWNDDKLRTFLLRDDKKAHRLPQEASIPNGHLNVPRETRITYRLDLHAPAIRDLIDLKNVTGLLFHRGSPETTFFLDNFQLLTEAEVASEEALSAKKELDAASQRLLKTKGHIPPPLVKRAEKLKKELTALAAKGLTPDNRESWRSLVAKANEHATLIEVTLNGKRFNSYSIITTGSTEKVFRESPVKPLPATFAAAGNERSSFQVIVAPERSLKAFKIRAGELTSDTGAAIPAAQVAINPVGYVEVLNSFYYRSSKTGWWPDPLLPNQSLDLEHRIQPYWITLYVPKDQKAGLYKGKLYFEAEGEDEQALEYELRVWDFSLPVRGTLQTLLSFVYNPSDQDIRRKCYETLLDHRISPVNIYINAGTENGYQPAREDLEFCLDRGLNTLVIWHPYDKTAPFPYDLSEGNRARMASFIHDYKLELEKHGAWKMAMVLGWDEVTHKGQSHTDQATAAAMASAQFLKKEFPDLRLGNIGGPPLIDGMGGLMNVWIPQTSIVDYIARGDYSLEQLTTNGNELFLYWVYGDPSFMLDLPGIAPRVLSWIAYKYGAKGIGYYSIIRGPDFHNAPTEVDWPHPRYNVETTKRAGRNADGSLVYPARDRTILSSIRLANTRDGIQDYEYFALLQELVEKTGDPEARALLSIPDSLLTHRDYPADSARLLDYRAQVAKAIERLIESSRTEPVSLEPLK